jgi:hypothetical protein
VSVACTACSKEEDAAREGWRTFGTGFDATALEDAVKILLKGPQESTTIVTLLSRSSTKVMLTSRDLELLNANAGYHSLAIDPLEKMLFLGGKAMERVLCQKYNVLKYRWWSNFQ